MTINLRHTPLNHDDPSNFQVASIKKKYIYVPYADNWIPNSGNNIYDMLMSQQPFQFS